MSYKIFDYEHEDKESQNIFEANILKAQDFNVN